MEYVLPKDYVAQIIKDAYMAGFSQGTAQNIGTTNALEKAKEYAEFMLGERPNAQRPTMLSE